MNMDDRRFEDTQDLYQKMGEMMNGVDQHMVGFVLGRLVTSWVGSHQAKSDDQTHEIQVDALHRLVDLVHTLMPGQNAAIMEATGRGKTRQ